MFNAKVQLILFGFDWRRGSSLIGYSLVMKVVSSIKTLKNRHPDCKVVRRKGRLYVINKTNPRFKARQGWFFINLLSYTDEKRHSS